MSLLLILAIGIIQSTVSTGSGKNVHHDDRTRPENLRRRKLFDSSDNPTTPYGRDNGAYYDPTPDEIESGYTLHPSKFWGALMRKQKALRIAFIGGSQTAMNPGFVSMFETAMKKEYPTHWNLSNFVVYNEGLSGHAPERRIFSFFHQPPEKWPNVIGFAYSLNCENAIWWCVVVLDNVVEFINGHYEQLNLTLPVYYYTEFFRTDVFYRPHWTGNHLPEFDPLRMNISAYPNNYINTTAIKQLNPLGMEAGSHDFMRGGPSGMFFLEFCRFYRLPYISLKDALFPSFARFYTTHNETDFWPYGGSK